MVTEGGEQRGGGPWVASHDDSLPTIWTGLFWKQEVSTKIQILGAI